jgi:predicted permease
VANRKFTVGNITTILVFLSTSIIFMKGICNRLFPSPKQAKSIYLADS